MNIPSGTTTPIRSSLRDLGGDGSLVGDRGDACQLGFQRSQAERIAPGLVHEAGVEVAHLLFARTTGMTPGLFRLLDDRTQLLLDVFGGDPEYAPIGAVGRDLHRLEPFALRVVKKIVLCADGPINRAAIHARQHSRLGPCRRGCRRQSLRPHKPGRRSRWRSGSAQSSFHRGFSVMVEVEKKPFRRPVPGARDCATAPAVRLPSSWPRATALP